MITIAPSSADDATGPAGTRGRIAALACRWMRSGARCLAALGLGLAVGLAAVPGDVAAQSRGPIVQPGDTPSGGGFHPLSPLFRLFGVERDDRRSRMREQQPREQVQPRREPVKPVIVEVPKDADARIVLVVGDGLADELAEGLEAAYAEVPSVRVDRLLFRDEGLATEFGPEIGDRMRAAVQGRRVGVVVMLLGKNDIRELAVRSLGLAGEPAEFGTEAWTAGYAGRVDRVLSAARAQRTPVIWVGLPPPKGQTRRANFNLVTSLIKARVEAANAIYVDVWDVFLSEEGGYTSFGPDVEGRRRRLRSGDGIGFTWPGKRKLAFFADRAIARVLGSSGAYAFEGVEDDPNFVVLTGRTGSPETELAGAEDARNAPVVDTPQYRLIVQGAVLPPTEGRVDDFRRPGS
ncbi:DUF459 domain-containing protein [Stappia sp.]|uniref:SGNH/GDSL hydrolase family protein n=1 Tax=Stappia sp. TaxID=1870903 RepID=UPI0032D98797